MMRFDSAYNQAIDFIDRENLISSSGAIVFSELDYTYLSTGSSGDYLIKYVCEIYHSNVLMDRKYGLAEKQKRIAEVYLIGLLVIVEKEYYNGMVKAFRYATNEYDNNRYYRILRNIVELLSISLDSSGRKYENFFLDTLGYNTTFVSNVIRNFPTFWRHYSVLEIGVDNFIKQVKNDYVTKMILSDEYDELLNICHLHDRHQSKTVAILDSLVDYVNIRDGVDSTGMLMNQNYQDFLSRNTVLNSFFDQSNYNFTLSKFRKLINNISKDTVIILPDGREIYSKDYLDIYLGTHYIGEKRYEVVINNEIDNKFIFKSKRGVVNRVDSNMFLYISEHTFKVKHPYRRVKLYKCVHSGKVLYLCYLGYPIGYEIIVDNNFVKPKNQILFTPLLSLKWDEKIRSYIPVLKVATIRIHNNAFRHKRVELLINGNDAGIYYYFNESGFLGHEDIYLSNMSDYINCKTISFKLICNGTPIVEESLEIKDAYLFDIAKKTEITSSRYHLNKKNRLVLFQRENMEYHGDYEYKNYLSDVGFVAYSLIAENVQEIAVGDYRVAFVVNNNYLRFGKDNYSIDEEIYATLNIEHVELNDVYFVLSNKEKKITDNIGRYIEDGHFRVQSILNDQESNITCGKWTIALYYDGKKILENWFSIQPLAEFTATKTEYYDGESIKGKLLVNYGDNVFENEEYLIGNAHIKDDNTPDMYFNLYVDNYDSSIPVVVEYDVFKLEISSDENVIYSFPHVVDLQQLDTNIIKVMSTNKINIEFVANDELHLLNCHEGENTFKTFAYVDCPKDENKFLLIAGDYNKSFKLFIRSKVYRPEIFQVNRSLVCKFRIDAIDYGKYIAKIIHQQKIVASESFPENGKLDITVELDEYNDKDLVIAAIEEQDIQRPLEFSRFELSKTVYDLKDVKQWMYKAFQIIEPVEKKSVSALAKAAEEFTKNELLIF